MVSIKDLFILYGSVIFFLKVCSFIVFFRLSVLWRVPGHYFAPDTSKGSPWSLACVKKSFDTEISESGSYSFTATHLSTLAAPQVHG